MAACSCGSGCDGGMRSSRGLSTASARCRSHIWIGPRTRMGSCYMWCARRSRSQGSSLARMNCLNMVVQRLSEHCQLILVGGQQSWIRARWLQEGFHVRWRDNLSVSVIDIACCPRLVGSLRWWRRWGALHRICCQNRWWSRHSFRGLLYILGIFALLFSTALRLAGLLLGVLLVLHELVRHGEVALGQQGVYVANEWHTLLVHRHAPRAAHQHILRLQVRVDNATHTMQII
mmetsp:Transcript_7375/g.11706  ORF Transcript_7375/g.11706 Transcript_7375/m.11706 type:complete len:232 (-) Transcript_7375:704-1399(-)